jgi:hypothetical protein
MTVALLIMFMLHLNTHYHTKFHNNKINGTSIITPFTVCTATMLVLLMVGNYKIQRWWWP